MARIMDVAKAKGEKGIQRQRSLYFKSPYTTTGEQAQHDPFKQEDLLLAWAKSLR
jgi:myo-inositol-1-phosphate synthase